MAEGARLESVYTATYRGFESPPHRHILRRARTQVRAFFSHIARLRGDEKPRPGFDYWRSQLDRPGCPQGERSESIPPSPPYSKKSSYESASFFFAYCTPGGMRSPDRGSTTGAASWTDHEHSEWAARRASEASQSPLTAIFKEKLVRKYEFFFAFYLPVRQ